MRITLVLCLEMSSFKSMFIGVTARSQVRQRVLPEGLNVWKFETTQNSRWDDLRRRGGSGAVREASLSFVCLRAICFRVWFSVFLA